MFTWGIICGFLAFVQTPWQFYLIRFLLGVCEASLYPVIYAVLFPRWFSASERAVAISLMLTSLPISNIIGAPLAGILLELRIFGLQGWQSLFILEAVPAVVFTFIFLFWVKDRPQKSQWLTDVEKQYMIEIHEKEQEAMHTEKKYTIFQALTDKTVWCLVCIYFFWATGFWGFSFWMPQVLKGLSGWSTSLIGIALIIPMVIALIGQVIWGHSSSRTGEKRWHIAIAMLIGAVGLAGAPFITNPLLSLVFITLVAVGVNSAMGIWWSVPTTFLSGAAAAGATAMINSLANLGGYFGPYMLGFVKTQTGTTDLGYFILSGGLVISAVLMVTMKKNISTSTQRKESSQ